MSHVKVRYFRGRASYYIMRKNYECNIFEIAWWIMHYKTRKVYLKSNSGQMWNKWMYLAILSILRELQGRVYSRCFFWCWVCSTLTRAEDGTVYMQLCEQNTWTDKANALTISYVLVFSYDTLVFGEGKHLFIT